MYESAFVLYLNSELFLRVAVVMIQPFGPWRWGLALQSLCAAVPDSLKAVLSHILYVCSLFTGYTCIILWKTRNDTVENQSAHCWNKDIRMPVCRGSGVWCQTSYTAGLVTSFTNWWSSICCRKMFARNTLDDETVWFREMPNHITSWRSTSVTFSYHLVCVMSY